MTSKINHLNYIDEACLFNESIFTRYRSQRYINSDNLVVDNEFGWHDIALLHLETGLRCEFSIYENYFGEVEYKLLKMVIATLDEDQQNVIDVDFERKVVLAENIEVPFKILKKYYQ